DEAAKTPWNIEDFAQSVKTGRTQEEIAGDLPAHKKVAPKKKAAAQHLEKVPGALHAPIPGFFEPMSSYLTDQLPNGDDWIFEVKWDGIRGLAFIEDGTLSFYTRNANRCERQYPELLVIPHYIEASQAILDGEIVVLDENGVSHFELIQSRIHSQDANAIAKMGQKNPVHFYAFDLLYLAGYDLRKVQLIERKKLLQKIVKPFPLLHVSAH